MDGSSPPRVLSLFVCFARQDEIWCRTLDNHLSLLKEQGWITCWFDWLVQAGMEREDIVAQQRQTADVFLLLISANFLASQECRETMLYTLQREREGTAVVLPILLHAVDWQRAEFSQLQMLPKNSIAVTSWANTDEAFQQIAQEIRFIVGHLRRWVVLACSPLHQLTLTRMASDLETHHVSAFSPVSQVNLKDAMRLSSTVVLLTSPETCSSQIDREVMDLAIIHQRHVIILWLPDEEDAPVPQQWRGNICIDVRPERYDLALQEVLVQLKSRLLAPPRSEPAENHQPRNPYKGLRPFGSSDVSDFFGRETLVEDCLRVLQQARLTDMQGQEFGRLLAVIGPSGLGKSSVVMAGVLPSLRAGALPGSETWISLGSLVPGTDPIEALTIALSEHFPEKGLKTIREDLQEDSARSLHQYAMVLAQRQPLPGTPVVLVVDQFEELFTQTVSEEKRRLFLDLLINAITVPRGLLVLILTLRADFSERVMLYPDVYRLIDAHHCLVLPMEVPNLRRVIGQPAILPDVQLHFEEDLVSDLLLEMQGQVGALPLLQFALDQLFQKRDGHLLTSKAYHGMGGVKGALTQHAETTFADLPTEEHRNLARTLFLRLITPGTTEQETTRRRAKRSELEIGDPTQTRLLRETADTFIAKRLLTTNEVAGVATIEVSHEALLREWSRLADWVSEARKDLRLQHVLSEDVVEWEQHNKPVDRLYRGIQLKEARAWGRRYMPSANEITFLRASAARHILSTIRVIVLILLLVFSISTAGWYALHQPPDTTRVTNLNDNGQGSLRWCIENALSESTITFDERVRGTIHLTSGDVTFVGGKKLTVQGPGANVLIISSGHTNSGIHVFPGAFATISNVSFKDSIFSGNLVKGLIINEGILTLNNSIVSGNISQGNSGGGVYNASILMINSSTILNNSTTSAAGGIYNAFSSSVTLTNSTISGNNAIGPGGGIYNEEGTITIASSIVSNNKSHSSGGGIYNNNGKVTIARSVISNNSTGSDGIGGGIYNGGEVTLINSTLSSNVAGGIVNYSNGNHAALSLIFCTMYGNDGGILNEQEGNIGSNTFIRNSIIVRNSSVVRNIPDIYVGSSDSLISGGYNLIQNSVGATFVLNEEHTTDQFVPDISSMFANNVHLSNNGGPTQTLALLLDLRNPALNAIPLASCQIKEIYDEHSRIYTDQRGMVRPEKKKTICDTGAYEAQM